MRKPPLGECLASTEPDEINPYTVAGWTRGIRANSLTIQYFDTRTIDADLMMYLDIVKQKSATNEADRKQKRERRNKI